jgi:hypothetical protein
MLPNTGYYVPSKPQRIKAIQFVKDNIKDVINFCGAELIKTEILLAHNGGLKLILTLMYTTVEIWEGDYLCYQVHEYNSKKSNITSYDKDDFQRNFVIAEQGAEDE